MIGVAERDLLCPIELLGQKAAHQQMWPGHGPQRQDKIGRLPQGFIEPVGPADQESGLIQATAAPGGELLGEGLGGKAATLLVQGDDNPLAGAPGEHGPDQLAFPALQGRGRQGPAFLDLDQLRRRPEPAFIVLVDSPERTGSRPADGDDEDAQSPALPLW